MVGQRYYKDAIDALTLLTMPHSLMVIGEWGMGKHTLVNEIVNKLNINLVDITSNLSLECLNEIAESVTPTIYLIDGNAITDRESNLILKFLEEPTLYAYIIILYEHPYDALNTIYNRCIKWELHPYSKDELIEIVGNSNNIELSSIPGVLLQLEKVDVNYYINLADNILTNIGKANSANILVLTNKLAFKNEQDKISPRLFFILLLEKAFQKVLNESLLVNTEQYDITLKLVNDSRNTKLDLKLLWEKYLFDLKMIAEVYSRV